METKAPACLSQPAQDSTSQIKEFIFSLHISADIQGELAADELLHKHYFYLQLAHFLAPVFPAITPAELTRLTGYSYLYFRFLLGLDSLLDGQAGSSATASTSQRLFAYLSIHEQAVRGLALLFPAPDSFWPHFERCKQEYAAANLREKKIAAQRSPFSEALFEEVAAGKSAVCYAMVHALSSLNGNDTQVVEPLRQCLRHLHVAMQYLDDIEDFRQDWSSGQFTYAHALVEDFLVGKGLVAQTLAPGELHRYLYTSGVAQQLLQAGHHHYCASQAIAQSLGLPALADYLQLQITKCRTYQQEVESLLLKTQIKASKSFHLMHATPPAATPPVLRAALSQALQHLRRSRDARGCWSDFMTSAGESRLWATAFVGLQLAETREGLSLAHEAFDASFFLPAAYNESILQDGDSTNFAMGLRRRVWGETHADQRQAWLAFMNPDGGWVTYRQAEPLRRRLELPERVSVDAWLTPKLCVTAAAAYVLTQYRELAAEHRLSCDYLVRQQHPDGFWASYWWTSPVYATAFAVLALAPLPQYLEARTAALHWLLRQQHADGAWYDAVSPTQGSAFYTGLAMQALLTQPELTLGAVAQAARWLLGQQTTDGSWRSNRILRIPATNVADPDSVKRWRASSFGVNVLVDDHNRAFTTSTALNALSRFAQAAPAFPTHS